MHTVRVFWNGVWYDEMTEIKRGKLIQSVSIELLDTMKIKSLEDRNRQTKITSMIKSRMLK